MRVAALAAEYRHTLPLRCGHRPDRLSPPRPQRSRRPHRHPAAALRQNQGPPAALPALRQAHRRGPRAEVAEHAGASSSKRRSKRRARRRQAAMLAKLPDYWDDLHGRAATSPSTKSTTGLRAASIARHQQRPHHATRTVPHPSQGQEAARAAAGDGRAASGPSTTAWPRLVAFASLAAARHARPPQRPGLASAAPSTSATPS